MPNLVYDFTFPRRALGLDVTITNRAGQVVSIETDPTLVLTAANGNAHIQVTLPDENAPYSAAAGSARVGSFSTEGSVALGASIADAPGASETAYLIAEGSGVTDYEYNTLTVALDGDAVSFGAIESNKFVFSKAGSVRVFCQPRGEFDYGEPVTIPDLYYTATFTRGGGWAIFTLKAGELLPEGSSAVGSGVTVICGVDGSSAVVGAEAGTEVVFKGSAGAVEVADAPALFDATFAIEFTPVPTLP